MFSKRGFEKFARVKMSFPNAAYAGCQPSVPTSHSIYTGPAPVYTTTIRDTVVDLFAKSIFLTGANRGIGLELVKQLTKSSEPPRVFAACRKPEEAKELQELAKERECIKIIEFPDLKNYDSYERVVKEVEKVLEEDGTIGLNLLINNAGILPKEGKDLCNVTPEHMMNVYEVNAVAPMFVTRAFHALLKKASANDSSKPLSCARAAVVNITSQMGSVALTTTSHFYHYRASKSGLNMITKCLSLDMFPDNILVVAIHPGWVKTDMGGPNAPLTVAVSVENIIDTLCQLRAQHNGQFLSYDGSLLPW